MLIYIAKRLGYGALIVWFLATATFFAMHAVPGDPLSQDKAMNAQVRANLNAYYGLDLPIQEQYLRYLGNLMRGDLGYSFVEQNRHVNTIIAEHFPVSASLGLLALLIAILASVLFAAIAAHYRGRWPDYVLMAAVILFVSVPSFVLAALAQLGILGINEYWQRSILPLAGWGSWRQVWIPALVLGLSTTAYLTRLLRGSLLDVAEADYIRTAKAKGLSSYRIFWRHQLSNAFLPVLTTLGPAIAALATGGFVVEQVFAIPGLGRYFVQAIQALDYSVIMGTTVFYGAFLVICVITVDLLYGVLDPRIRLESH